MAHITLLFVHKVWNIRQLAPTLLVYSQAELFVNSPLLMLTVPEQANSAFPIEEYPVELHLNPMSVNGTVKFAAYV